MEFGGAFCVLHFYWTHFQTIFLSNQNVHEQIFSTILKMTGGYILLLKTTKIKYQYMNDENS